MKAAGDDDMARLGIFWQTGAQQKSVPIANARLPILLSTTLPSLPIFFTVISLAESASASAAPKTPSFTVPTLVIALAFPLCIQYIAWEEPATGMGHAWRLAWGWDGGAGTRVIPSISCTCSNLFLVPCPAANGPSTGCKGDKQQKQPESLAGAPPNAVLVSQIQIFKVFWCVINASAL